MTSQTLVLTGGPPWGFRISGGKDKGLPVHVSKVNKASRAYSSGLREGDYIRGINGRTLEDYLHTQVVNLIKDTKPGEYLVLHVSSLNRNNYHSYTYHHTTHDMQIAAHSTYATESFVSYQSQQEVEKLKKDNLNHSSAHWVSSQDPSEYRAHSPPRQHTHNTSSATHYTPAASAMADGGHPSVPKDSEIPATSTDAKGGKSKGVNLFLARQKMIADMMEAEEEAAKAAEEEQRRHEEELKRQEVERKKREEIERKRAEELRKKEEARKQEEERLLESKRAAEARAAKYKPSRPLPGEQKVAKFNAKIGTNTDPGSNLYKENFLRISESLPKTVTQDLSSKQPKVTLDSNSNIKLSKPKLSLLSNGKNDSDEVFGYKEFKLPRSQPPTVTLLQKSRVSESDSVHTDSDMHKIRECLSTQSGFIPLQAGDIPRGAIYIGTDERIVGGYKETDTFYLVPSGDMSHEEDISKTSDTVDSTVQGCSSAQQNELHITEEDNSENAGVETKLELDLTVTSGPDNAVTDKSAKRHTTHAKHNGAQTTSKQIKSKEEHHSKEWYSNMYKKMHKVDTKDENSYQPTYVFPEQQDSAETDVQPGTDNSYTPTYQFPEHQKEKPASKNLASSSKGHERTQLTCTETREVVETTSKTYTADVLSPTKEALPVTVKDKVSSKQGDLGKESKELTVDTTETGEDNPFKEGYTPAPQSEQLSPAPLSPKLQYREVQKGGEIPLSGLRKPAPPTPTKKVAPPPLPRVHSINNHQRLSTRYRVENVPVSNIMIAEKKPNNLPMNQTPSTGHSDSASHAAVRSHSVPRALFRHPSLKREGNLRPNFRRSFHRTTSTSPQRPDTYRRSHARHSSLDRPGGHNVRPNVSPAGSVTSLNSASSRASSRQSLVIVPPRTRSGRSEIRQGEITTRRVRSVSAAQELNVTTPPALNIRLSEVPKYVPPPVASYDRDPEPITREQKDINDAKRKEILTHIEQEERLKKAREEEADRRSRRHSDYFTWKEKSPIPHDRYDQPYFPLPHSPAARSSTSSCHSPRSVSSSSAVTTRLAARVLYEFKAQHPRELNAEKGEIIDILRRVDANWYEGSRDGIIGIIPVTYVQIIREQSVSPPIRPAPPRLREGTGVAKFNFVPQSPVELALKKGDQVILTRRVDSNWFEGRIRNRAGIFPISYIQVISEPDIQSGVVSPQQMSPSMNRSQSVPEGYNIRPRSSVPSPNTTSPINSRAYAQVSPANHLIRCSSDHSTSEHLLASQHHHHNNNNNSYSKTIHENNNVIKELKSLPYAVANRDQSVNTVIIAPCRGIDMPSFQCLYNYEPRNEDELQLREGDIVHVIEKCDDGWYVGTSGRTGLFGTFPGNYVTPI